MLDKLSVGIMQPYFFPYIGYWQLLNAVDRYVIYDDVNYIKGGWINRNRIINNGEVKYFNLQMVGASSNKHINEIGVCTDRSVIEKNLRILEASYKKALHFDEAYPIFEQVLTCGEEKLSKYLLFSINCLKDYLGIETEIVVSSEIERDTSLKSQDAVIDICKRMNATEYINSYGGQHLYNVEEFKKEGIDLKFLKPNEIRYRQFDEEFNENLSIIDVLMFNDKDEVKKMLLSYSLI